MAGSEVQVALFIDKATSTPWKGDPVTGAAMVTPPGGPQTAFAESTTPLGGAATFTGSGHTNTYGSPFFVADFYSDQAGTAFVEKSPDGVTWTPVNGVAGTALTAGASLQIKVATTAARYRVRLLNGATPETVLSITSAFNFN